MAYYLSQRYKLPVPVSGAAFEDSEEQKIADILDRVLQRIVQLQTPLGSGCGVVKEGTFVGEFVSGASRVYVSPTSLNPALFAFVNYMPIYATETVEWTGLLDDTTYYLYIRVVEDDYNSTGQYGDFETVASTSLITTDSTYTLIGKAVTTGLAITVTQQPAEKAYIRYLSDYDSDYDGIVDDSKQLEGKTLSYVLNRGNHTGTIDWLDIDTTTNKIVTDNISENERVSLRFQEIFGDCWIEGTTPATSADLTHSIPEQTLVVQGIRVVVPATSETYLPDRDNYVDCNSAGAYTVTAVARGAAVPALSATQYRLFKVETRYEEKATGYVWIHRQPTVGDTVKVHDTTFTACLTSAEVAAGNLKFWIGSADIVLGWKQCALSLITAINTSTCPCSASLGTAQNEVALLSQKVGAEGNEDVVVSVTEAGDITAEGLSAGHSACIFAVTDFRAQLYPYWKEPVATYSGLPLSGGNGETRLVLDTNKLYRYDTTASTGVGTIQFHQLPSHGNRLHIGKMVAEASSGITNTEMKQFQVYDTGALNNDIYLTMQSLKQVVNSSYYPYPAVIASMLSVNQIQIESVGTEDVDNRTIELLSGTAANFALSGIEGAGGDTGWQEMQAGSAEETLTIVRRGAEVATSGQDLFWLPEFEPDMLFVYKDGIYKESTENYDIVGPSGIQFTPGFLENERMSYVILDDAANLEVHPLRTYTFITKNSHPELLQSIDLDSHHVLHDNLSHDTAPISDPASAYAHRGTYAALGNHIGDDIAHAMATQLDWRWLINGGTSTEKFRIEFSKIFDFSDTIGQHESSGMDISDGEFWYYAGVVDWEDIYTSSHGYFLNAVAASGIESENRGLYWASYEDTLYGTLEGASWTDYQVIAGQYVYGLSEYSGRLYSSADDGKLYVMDSGTWVELATTSAVGLWSLGVWNDKLAVGGDGEVYEYHSGTGLSTTAIVDVPVTRITALREYGGVLHIGTYLPGKCYRFDGATVTEETSMPSVGYVNAFYEFEGDLYAATGTPNIYRKSTISGLWEVEWTTSNLSNWSFAVYDSTLYCGGTRYIYRKDGGTWEVEHDFGSNSRIFLCATDSNLYACHGALIYKKIADLGWQLVPAAGLDTTTLDGHEVKFLLNNTDQIAAIKKAGSFYARWKQYPTDNEWTYYPNDDLTPSSDYMLKSVYDTDTDGRVDNAENVSDGTNISSAVQVKGAVTNSHTHANKALLDTYTQSNANLAAAVTASHAHANKATLDTYDQTNVDIADAVSKKHASTVLGTKTVDETAIGNGKVMVYRTASGQLEYEVAGGGGGAFTDLTDVPASYDGQAAKFLVVNDGEDGVAFEPLSSGIIAFTDLVDAPASYSGQSGLGVFVNPGETGLQFQPVLQQNIHNDLDGLQGGTQTERYHVDSAAAAFAEDPDFIELDDAPDSYTDKSGMDVVVNAGETGLEFIGRPDINSLNSATFKTAPSVPGHIDGRVFYDTTWKALAYETASDVTVQIGQETMCYVYNNTGTQIDNGQVVYTSGASDGIMTVALAQADDFDTSFVLGVATQNIPDGQYGLVTVRGNINEMDTSAFVAGDPLYLSEATAGLLTNVVPPGPNYEVRVGRCLISDASTGRIFVNVRPAFRLTDLANVTITNPEIDQRLRYNGTEWVNAAPVSSSAGNGVEFYPDVTAIIGTGADNDYAVETLNKYPVTTAENVDTISCASNTVLKGFYLYNSVLGVTTIDAGTWTFKFYASVSSTLAGRVSTLTKNVYKVSPYTDPTVTITGTGTSRTCTASGGTPFAVANIDASATNTVASFVQTPLGIYQITARTSDTVVTITTPATYTNESGVAFSVYKKLLGATSPTITSLTTNYSLYTTTSVQSEFTVAATDKLALAVFGTSNNTTDVYYAYNGNTHYSNFVSPLVILHNDLNGLYGTADYYHVSQTAATFAENPSLVDLDDTPANYSGASGMGLFVNAAGNAVEFLDKWAGGGGGGGGGVTEFTALTDTPASYSGNSGLDVVVNSGETGLAFIARPVVNRTIRVNFAFQEPVYLPVHGGRSTASAPVWYNNTGLPATVQMLRGISDSTYQFKLFRSASNVDISTGTDVQLDEVVCDQAGTSCYYREISAGFDSSTIPPQTYLIFEHGSGMALSVHGFAELTF